jgi:hypothetical protein
LGAAELDMDNQQAARDYALELAKFQRGGQQGDPIQRINNIMGQNPDLTFEQAASLLQYY